MSDQIQTMKEEVRQRYGALADKVNQPATTELVQISDGFTPSTASCCGPVGCCDPASESQNSGVAEMFYSESELADLPESVTDISLGCGNPMAIAGLKAGEIVLDLGSGGGIDCFLAAKQVGPTGQVIGVDMTDNMLALANQNKIKLGLDNVDFRKGEIEDLPVDSDSVDVIISNCVINLSPDKDAVFQEAFRVLKSGGRFTVSDMVTEGTFPEQLQKNMNAWAGCITGALDQADYLTRLRNVGFTQVEVESRKSYGLENVEELDSESYEALTKDLDWSTVPNDVRLFGAQIVAYKP